MKRNMLHVPDHRLAEHFVPPAHRPQIVSPATSSDDGKEAALLRMADAGTRQRFAGSFRDGDGDVRDSPESSDCPTRSQKMTTPCFVGGKKGHASGRGGDESMW